MLTECVAQTQLLDEALDFLDIPLNPCRLGAPYYADMVMNPEEFVDLGNYSTSVVCHETSYTKLHNIGTLPC